MNALPLPSLDPSPIFELFRGSYATDLLTAAVAHFNVFDRLADAPLKRSELRSALGLAERPMIVLTTALQAMGLLTRQKDDHFALTPLAREHLVRDTAFDVGNYLSLAATNPSVLHMVERLRTNRPAGLTEHDAGAAFIYRDGIKSAMDQSDLAEHFTLACRVELATWRQSSHPYCHSQELGSFWTSGAERDSTVSHTSALIRESEPLFSIAQKSFGSRLVSWRNSE